MLGSKTFNSEWLTKLEALASEVATREGCELYDLEFLGTGQGRTLRVFIDKAEGPVGIEDCSNVSKGLNLILDVEDIIPGEAYNLEVSSPGLERDLKRVSHFTRVVGEKIWVRLSRSLGQILGEDLPVPAFHAAKQLNVRLTGADEAGIQVELEEKTIRIPWAEIEKGKLVFEYATNEKPQNKAKKEKPKAQKKKKR